MIADTITPIYPSKLKPINGEITVDTKTALVPITSDIESRAVASNIVDSYFFDNDLL